MTIDEIKTQIEAIKEAAIKDYEWAHILEDNLRDEFIEYITTFVGEEDPKLACLVRKAFLVLSNSDINFNRWYSQMKI